MKYILTARRYASAVYAMALCPSVSVCVCVCLSVCHGVVGARGYVSRRNCFSRLLGFPSARVACVAAEVTRCLGGIFPVHVSRVLRSRHTCRGCLLCWLSGSFRRHL